MARNKEFDRCPYCKSNTVEDVDIEITRLESTGGLDMSEIYLTLECNDCKNRYRIKYIPRQFEDE